MHVRAKFGSVHISPLAVHVGMRARERETTLVVVADPLCTRSALQPQTSRACVGICDFGLAVQNTFGAGSLGVTGEPQEGSLTLLSVALHIAVGGRRSNSQSCRELTSGQHVRDI